jgi:hypothetical protein
MDRDTPAREFSFLAPTATAKLGMRKRTWDDLACSFTLCFCPALSVYSCPVNHGSDVLLIKISWPN